MKAAIIFLENMNFCAHVVTIMRQIVILSSPDPYFSDIFGGRHRMAMVLRGG